MKIDIMSKDTLKEKKNSFNNCDREMQDVEAMNLANIPEMTEDELDQATKSLCSLLTKGKVK